MNITEAKEFISTIDPKGLALEARRSDAPYPVKWREHRQGGGVVIDDAEIDYTNMTDKDIILFAKYRKISFDLWRMNYGKTLYEIF